MIKPLQYHAVNWVDGMKISREHLVHQENFVIDLLRDANSIPINALNYGLLPATEKYGDKNLYEIHNTATNDAQLVIKKCTAVTLAGHRIELTDYKVNIRRLAKEMTGATQEEAEGVYYILASVNPFEKIPFGDIDSEEIPPRHPFTQPSHRIELVDVSVLNGSFSGGNYLVLGKVAIKSGIAQIDSNFIPPCTAVESHPKLMEYHGSFSSALGNIRQSAFKIIQKTSHKNQNNVMADNVKTMCRTIIRHTGENYFQLKNMVPVQPPVVMMNIFAKLALHLYNDTQMMVQAELEELLNYSMEWSEISPHTLLNQLSTVAEINYDHHNTGEDFFNISQLLKSLEHIFGKLSDLDYIGQRKENIIVNEQEVKSTNDPKKGWSVID